MSDAPPPTAPFTDLSSDAALLARYGIERVPVDQFRVDGYRYSSLPDAVAQARRSRAANDG